MNPLWLIKLKLNTIKLFIGNSDDRTYKVTFRAEKVIYNCWYVALSLANCLCAAK